MRQVEYAEITAVPYIIVHGSHDAKLRELAKHKCTEYAITPHGNYIAVLTNREYCDSLFPAASD